MMSPTLSLSFAPALPARRVSRRDDDALAPMRGIIAGMLVSLAGFWIPLALVLMLAAA